MIGTKRKEELSISYLNALCAYVGVAVEIQRHDDDGIDGILKKKVKRMDGKEFFSNLGAQLKSTSRDLREDEKYIHYPLDVKNYNDLCMEATIPRVLMLLVLPEQESDWIIHNINELIIRKTMYWFSFKNESETKNTSSVTLKIDKGNYITSEKILELLQLVAEEERI